MSAFKIQKRKSSIKTEGSPGGKAIKLETRFSTPVKTPKQENKKTPKNQHKATPFVKSNKQTPNEGGSKLQMFSGTGKLDFKTPANAAVPFKKVFKTPNINTSSGKGKTPNSAVGPVQKESETLKTQSNEKTLNRHQRRRQLRGEKRRLAREKFKELKEKANHGDEVAKKSIEQKIAEFEGVGKLSKNKRRQLAILKRMLYGKVESTKNVVQAVKKNAISIQQKDFNKDVQKKSQSVKPVQTAQLKVPAKLDSDDDEEEEDDDDENEQESAEDDVGKGATIGSEDNDEDEDSEEEDDEEDDDDDEDGFSKLVIDEKVGSSEEGSDDDEDEDDKEQSDEDDEQSDEGEKQSDDDEEESDEQNAVTTNKKTVQQQYQQKNKPGKQEVPSKGPIGDQKKSRYVVFVGNIAYASTKDDLQEHFKKTGNIVDIRIPTSNEGKPRGFAYVELADEISYQKALSLNSSFLGGRKINVSYTQGGKKKSPNQKNEIKAKNFKLQAMRKQGQLQGSFKHNKKPFVRRGNNQKKGA